MKLFRTSLAALGLLAGLAFVPDANAQILPGQAFPNFKNLLDNPIFNFYQRGTTAITGITTTATYHADRWAGVAGTSTSSGLTNVTSSLPTGTGTPVFTNAEQLQRTAAQTGVVAEQLLQEIPTADITPLAGQPVTLSFWALVGSNFSAANSAITVKVVTGTGTDEGLATYLTGLAGAANAINTTVTGTANWQRFAVTGTLPATATEAVVSIGWTPVGTAGTNDYIQVTGVQLEQGTVATNLEVRPSQVELAKLQRYVYVINDTTAGIAVTPVGTAQGTTTTCTIGIPFPVTMRKAPTYTNALTASTFKIVSASQTATALSTPFSATLTGNAPTGASINFTTTGMTAKDSCFIVGAASAAGQMLWTADF